VAKIINLFNHKGGVSKTTTVFNLSWMLGLMGKRIVIADFDPQCNLTGMVLGYKGVDDLQDTYKADPPNNLKDALSPAFGRSISSPLAALACPTARSPGQGITSACGPRTRRNTSSAVPPISSTSNRR
jgi:nitrogenase subunit NifH